MSASSVRLLSLLVCGWLGAAASAATVTLPAGIRLHAQLNEDLSSDKVVPDHRFEATVTTPVLADGELVIPQGSRVEGRVTVVRSQAPSGVIGVRFVRLSTPAGRIYEIDGVLAPTRDGESLRIATTKKEAVVLIGDEADGPGKRASTLVGDAREEHGEVADRWSKTGLSAQVVAVRSGAEIVIELREPVTIRAAGEIAEP